MEIVQDGGLVASDLEMTQENIQKKLDDVHFESRDQELSVQW